MLRSMRCGAVFLLCAVLLVTTALASAPSRRSDISIRITPPSGEAVQRAEVEIQFTDRTGDGLQSAHVKLGGGSWREVTGQLDRTDDRYRYIAEICENGAVSARAIGWDGTVFEKSEEIDCFHETSSETADSPEEDAKAPEEEPKPVPLTPEGQGRVLDDATSEDGKEFFTVKTPNENVFYLVIDRQRNGENVYFLNAVTEADLMALAEQDAAGETGAEVSAIPEPEAEPVCLCKEQCAAGAVDTDCPVCTLSYKDCEGEPPAPSEGQTTEKAKGGGAGMFLVILAVLGVGGVGYYLKIYRPKHEVDDAEDFDTLVNVDETPINEDEDEDGDEDALPAVVPVRPVEDVADEPEPPEELL